MVDDKLNFKATTSGVELGVEGESAKGFFSALLDAISPFTELMGAGGDEIRYFRIHRQNTVLKTLNEAAHLRNINNIRSSPVDMKLLNPWIEGASLEFDGDEGISDLWARLLAKAPMDFSSNYALFIKILTMIGSSDAKVLQSLQERSSSSDRDPILDLLGQKSRIYQEAFESWEDSIFTELFFVEQSLDSDGQDDFVRTFFDELNCKGQKLGFRACQLVVSEEDFMDTSLAGKKLIFTEQNFGRDHDSFKILEAHNLVSSIQETSHDRALKHNATVYLYEITPLGRMLLDAVHVEKI